MKTGQKAAKQDVLTLFIKNGENSDAWVQKTMKVAKQFTAKEQKTKTFKPMTKGELIQKHGYQEAMDFIRRGKYRATTDADGDTVYVKVTERFEQTAMREETIKTERCVGGVHNATCIRHTIKQNINCLNKHRTQMHLNAKDNRT